MKDNYFENNYWKKSHSNILFHFIPVSPTTHVFECGSMCPFVYVNRLCFGDFPMRSFVVSSLLRIREETFKGRRRPFSFSAVRLSAWTSLQSYSMVSHLNSCDISYRMQSKTVYNAKIVCIEVKLEKSQTYILPKGLQASAYSPTGASRIIRRIIS